MSSTIGVLVFDQQEKAEAFLNTLKQMKKADQVQIEDLVYVVKDENGRYKIHETTDFTRSRGAITGGALGLIIGIMLGGPLGGLLLGGAIGWFTGKKIDLGISKEQINTVEEQMENGSEAVFVQLKEGNLDLLSAAIKQSGGELIDLSISDEVMVDVNESLNDFTARH
jgi:uncharacterized membrane protein